MTAASGSSKHRFDARKYKRMLSQAMPRPISDDRELARVQAAVDKLIEKPEDKLSPEESALQDTLSLLIEEYEKQHYPMPEAPPYKVLRMLMEDRGLKQTDLTPIFGSRGAVSRVLSGSREISKSQAKKLAEYFKLPVGCLSRAFVLRSTDPPLRRQPEPEMPR